MADLEEKGREVMGVCGLWTGIISLTILPVVGFCECGYEPVSQGFRRFPARLSYCGLLTKNSRVCYKPFILILGLRGY
jgi:hypothetical protein